MQTFPSDSRMGVRRGGQEGALAPLPPGPPENFALPWKKVCGRPCTVELAYNEHAWDLLPIVFVIAVIHYNREVYLRNCDQKLQLYFFVIAANLLKPLALYPSLAVH